MHFTKMEGAGNDYIYVDCFKEKVEDPSSTAKLVSDRHFGVGSDGMILICPSDIADCRMEMYNADGSRGKMCGNGVRCVGKYIYDNGYTNGRKTAYVETDAGLKILELIVEKGICTGAKVDMGEPVLTPKDIPVNLPGDRIVSEKVLIGENTAEITCVSMGNPHCIVFCDDIDGIEIEKIGPLFENDGLFPERVNTEFVKITGRDSCSMRVWERGSGETLACGTGACAVAVAAVLNGYCERHNKVKLKGGTLTITWDEKTNHVFMEGPAKTICKGEWNNGIY